jgi:hypothetical protein
MILHDVNNNEIKITSEIIDIIDWREAPVGRIINSTIILDDCQTCSVRETKEEIEGMKE